MNIFLDSGAHSIFHLITKKNKTYGESNEFWKYIDQYAEFIHTNKEHIKTYVNVDVIYEPELTWKVQKYLENTHKLNPMPVYHSGEDLKWLKLYIDNYDYIGIGGLAQDASKRKWMREVGDIIFNMICDTKDRLPKIRVHGFAMTTVELMFSYPWYSVDSSSWVQYGKYGMVLVPKFKHNEIDYRTRPWVLTISTRSKKATKAGTAFFENLTEEFKRIALEYFALKGFPVGRSEFKKVHPSYRLKPNEHWANRSENEIEIVYEKGLSNSHELRDRLNTLYYIDLQNAIPKWPWAWTSKNKMKELV